MNNKVQTLLAILRIAMGWLFFYGGITKVLDPTWSAAGYLGNAQTFPGFFEWLTSPELLPLVNILNEWGLTLIGLALIFGIWVRWVSILGAIMMVLYWFPVLNFPHVGDHSYIVDDHIIYALVLVYFASVKDHSWSLAKKIRRR